MKKIDPKMLEEIAKQKNIDIKVDITQSKQELFNNYKEDLDLLLLI